MAYRIGVDQGGTFTDFVLLGEDGQMSISKTQTVPHRPHEAFYDGLRLLAEDKGIGQQELLAQTDSIVVSTTIATNALLRGTWARTGLLCTEGFRDTLEIRLGVKEKRYDWYFPKPKMIVPRQLRMPVRERIWRERELIPLNREDVESAIEKFKSAGVEAVAISFLWSFVDPSHERIAADMVRASMPGAYVSCSSEVLPEIREYSRESTTVVNACLGPIVRRFAADVEDWLVSKGYRGAIRYFQTDGGLLATDTLLRKPVLLLNSGPAAGPIGGLFVGRLHGDENILTVDMGGTSFDTALVHDGIIDEIRDVDVGGYRVGVPMVRIHTLGAGGGSIAWIDSGGLLRVGPQSAEAVPGPACYDKGGELPTVTDANVVLGYFNPDSLLGGRIKLNSELSRKAIANHIAGPLHLTVEQAAAGIHEIVNANMTNGIRQISLERGFDTRDFVMVVGGSCSAGHCALMARELDIHKILIPRLTGCLCAFGAVIGEAKRDYHVGQPSRLTDLDTGWLNENLKAMEKCACQDLGREGFSPEAIRVTRLLYMRYKGEGFEVPVAIPDYEITRERIPNIVERLHAAHKQLYTFEDRESGCELISARLVAFGKQKDVRLSKLPISSRDPSSAQKGKRPCYFEGKWVDTPLFDGSRLLAGNRIVGPAIIEEPMTTIVVGNNSHVELNEHGTYVLTFDREVLPS